MEQPFRARLKGGRKKKDRCLISASPNFRGLGYWDRNRVLVYLLPSLKKGKGEQLNWVREASP